MTTWTVEKIAARFEEAANTIERLPAVRVQGYFNCWPTIKRQRWERLCVDDKLHRFPPDPRALDRLDETMAWLVCLDVEQRHLVWMRAEDEPWRDICARLGCDRTTAWRRWQRALQVIANKLNSRVALKGASGYRGEVGFSARESDDTTGRARGAAIPSDS